MEDSRHSMHYRQISCHLLLLHTQLPRIVQVRYTFCETMSPQLRVRMPYQDRTNEPPGSSKASPLREPLGWDQAKTKMMCPIGTQARIRHAQAFHFIPYTILEKQVLGRITLDREHTKHSLCPRRSHGPMSARPYLKLAEVHCANHATHPNEGSCKLGTIWRKQVHNASLPRQARHRKRQPYLSMGAMVWMWTIVDVSPSRQ